MFKKIKSVYSLSLLTTIVFFSLGLSFFYNYFVPIKEPFFDEKFDDVQGLLLVELPKEDVYLVKIWGLRYPDNVYLNDVEMSYFRKRERAKTKEIYIRAEAPPIKKGPNALIIVSDESYSVRIRNFYGATESEGVFVLFKSSRYLRFFPDRIIFAALLFFAILAFSWTIFYFLFNFIFLNCRFDLFFKLFLQYNSIFFFIIIFSIILVVFSPYRVILSRMVFLGWSISSLFLLNGFLLLRFILRHNPPLIFNKKHINFLFVKTDLSFENEEELYLHHLLQRFIIFFKARPDQCLIVSFIFLLCICMILLLFRLNSIANWISYLAYFCLVIGTTIKFIKLIKNKI